MTRPTRALIPPALFVACALAACEKEAAAPPPTPIPASDYTNKPFVPKEFEAAKPPRVLFADATAESGLQFTHVNGAQGKKYLPETMGAGVVLFDCDGDGRLDVYFVQGAEWPGPGPAGADGNGKLTQKPTGKLFRNLGGLKFQDVTHESGLDVPFLGMGATAADYDGDGDEDLFVTALGQYHLFRNDGPGNDGVPHFTDVAESAGLKTSTWKDKKGREHPSWSTSAAWLDYDCDGVPDLFVCHYVHWSLENDVFDTMNGRDKAYTQPTKYESDCCRLFRGKGDGTFEDVTVAAGLAKSDAKALGVALADLNHDGRPDIAVANDTQPNYLFVSQPGGKYQDVGVDAGMGKDGNGRARAGMGIDMAALWGDGRYTVSIGNFSGEAVSMYTQTGDDVYFVDQAAPMRVGPATELMLKFAVLFCDYDLDGRPDMLVCNGHIEPDIQTVRKETTYEEPPQLFWNNGRGAFTEVSRECGDCFQKRLVARGAAAGDLDGDGDLDFVVTQNGRPALLLRNDQATGNGWLRVRLQGSGKNRDALGATVTAKTAAGELTRDVRTGSSYLSQCDLAPTFGLGPGTKGAGGAPTFAPVDVTVRWPSGRRELFAGLAPNREHRLVEGQGKAQ
jgi:hypothetical protein